MITSRIWKDLDVDIEIDLDEDDIRQILQDLTWKDVVKLWEQENDEHVQQSSETVGDALYEEWFQKVKEKMPLWDAEKLIPVD